MRRLAQDVPLHGQKGPTLWPAHSFSHTHAHTPPPIWTATVTHTHSHRLYCPSPHHITNSPAPLKPNKQPATTHPVLALLQKGRWIVREPLGSTNRKECVKDTHSRVEWLTERPAFASWAALQPQKPPPLQGLTPCDPNQDACVLIRVCAIVLLSDSPRNIVELTSTAFHHTGLHPLTRLSWLHRREHTWLPHTSGCTKGAIPFCCDRQVDFRNESRAASVLPPRLPCPPQLPPPVLLIVLTGYIHRIWLLHVV
jgi:hypothetical protein